MDNIDLDGTTAMSQRMNSHIQSIVTVLLIGGLLFGSAGTVNILSFWLYLVVFAGICIAGVVLIDPSLAKERRQERLAIRHMLALTLVLAHWAIAGLDRGRLHWSDTVPRAIQLLALMLFAMALGLGLCADRENRFATALVRIQEDRGHHVITSGPYAFVRHPGYAAALVFFLMSGVALGSWLAALLGAIGLPFLLWRTVAEDRFLHENLAGYREYAQRVR